MKLSATIAGLSELYFRFRFIFLVQTKKVISRTSMATAHTEENHRND